MKLLLVLSNLRFCMHLAVGTSSVYFVLPQLWKMRSLFNKQFLSDNLCQVLTLVHSSYYKVLLLCLCVVSYLGAGGNSSKVVTRKQETKKMVNHRRGGGQQPSDGQARNGVWSSAKVKRVECVIYWTYLDLGIKCSFYSLSMVTGVWLAVITRWPIREARRGWHAWAMGETQLS